MLSMLLVISIKFPAIIIGLWLYRQLSLPYRLVLLQVILAVITEVTGYLIVRFYHQYNIWLFSIFDAWGDFLPMTLACYYLLNKTPYAKPILIAASLVLLTWFYGLFSVGILNYYTPFMLSRMIVMLFFYLILLYHSTFRRIGKLRLLPEFWLSLSVILFFGCNLPYYGLFNYLNEHRPDVLDALFHPIVWSLNFIRYPMVAISLYLAARQYKEKHHICT